MKTVALERLVRRAGRTTDVDRCELCAEPVPDRHRHLYDRRNEAVRCVCRACTVLFQREAAGDGHYRLIPERRLRLQRISAADLGAPVSLAFFVERPDGEVVARYPSPVGATRWTVDPERWSRAAEVCAPLRSMEPEVEAVLVNTVRGADEHWLVPLDDCYRLVGVVRRHWRGLSGGSRVWPEVMRFFAGFRADDERPGEEDPWAGSESERAE